MPLNENVLVVETAALLRNFPLKRGLNIIGNEIFEFILANHQFISRANAEQDPLFKQIIPYVVIRNGDLWLLFQRKSTQSEARLHNKYSLGIGGHINDEYDNETLDPITSGLYRELAEELTLPHHSTPRYVGVINDDESDVGKVHLGLVFEIHAESLDFDLPEADKMTATWVTSHDLQAYVPNMETWSQLIVGNL
ncbi:MAG: hypothetical protein FWE92_01435 [Defluviitaleaceae bacterium]|nr:hypothetical protein [Defluviitaleaceae bacterium]